MQRLTFALDPRYFQVIFQAIFLTYGILFLNWNADWQHYTISIGGCLLFQYAADSIRSKRFLKPAEFDRWGFSVLISAMSLCLLLKTNDWYVSLLTAFLTVASKYIFRFNKKHIFNPSAFGIVATILITKDAWLSPGQWGSNAVIFFLCCYPWNNCGDKSSKVRHQYCISSHVYWVALLAPGVYTRLANGSFHPFC